jgi:DNA replication protein DnaC
MKTIRSLIADRIVSDRVIKEIRREDMISLIYRAHPALEKIDEDLVDIRKQKLMAAMEHDTESTAPLAKREAELIRTRGEYISQKGIDPDFDEVKELCPKCHDTGFVTTKSGNKAVCGSCMKDELNECYEASGMADYSSYTLKSFDFGYIKGVDRKSVFNKIKKMFEDGYEGPSLMVYSSPSQTGKTYLAVCITKTAISLGKSAYYTKCENLAQLEEDTIDAIKHIDFLRIDDFADDVTLHDDIGTVLNNVLEVRNASGLCTVLVSALPAPELVRGCDMRVSGKLGRAGKIA